MRCRARPKSLSVRWSSRFSATRRQPRSSSRKRTHFSPPEAARSCRCLAESRHGCSMARSCGYDDKRPIQTTQCLFLGSTKMQAVPFTMSTLTPARRWCVTRAAGSACRSWCGLDDKAG